MLALLWPKREPGRAYTSRRQACVYNFEPPQIFLLPLYRGRKRSVGKIPGPRRQAQGGRLTPEGYRAHTQGQSMYPYEPLRATQRFIGTYSDRIRVKARGRQPA